MLLPKNCVQLHGEGGNVDLPAAEHQMQLLRDSLSKYSPDKVFNMDEAVHFFRVVPT